MPVLSLTPSTCLAENAKNDAYLLGTTIYLLSIHYTNLLFFVYLQN